jgi:hypothetical protein
MYGLTRATTTLIGAGAAGLLLWLATQLNNGHDAGYWGIVGLIAAAGLVMALSQLLGGWTKWGWPRLSPAVFLFAFVPIAVVSLWVILAGEPGHAWLHNHVLAWTRDIHVSGLVTDLLRYIPVLAFGAGLAFGFSFDTTGPRREVAVHRERTRTRGRRADRDATAADEPLTVERDETSADTRELRHDREPVTPDGRSETDATTPRRGDDA